LISILATTLDPLTASSFSSKRMTYLYPGNFSAASEIIGSLFRRAERGSARSATISFGTGFCPSSTLSGSKAFQAIAAWMRAWL
jgi:hypothetical protein